MISISRLSLLIELVLISIPGILFFTCILLTAKCVLAGRERLWLPLFDVLLSKCGAWISCVCLFSDIIDASASRSILFPLSQLGNDVIEPLDALIFLVDCLFNGLLVFNELLFMFNLELLQSLFIEDLDFVNLLLSKLAVRLLSLQRA